MKIVPLLRKHVHDITPNSRQELLQYASCFLFPTVSQDFFHWSLQQIKANTSKILAGHSPHPILQDFHGLYKTSVRCLQATKKYFGIEFWNFLYFKLVLDITVEFCSYCICGLSQYSSKIPDDIQFSPSLGIIASINFSVQVF